MGWDLPGGTFEWFSADVFKGALPGQDMIYKYVVLSLFFVSTQCLGMPADVDQRPPWRIQHSGKEGPMSADATPPADEACEVDVDG